MMIPEFVEQISFVVRDLIFPLFSIVAATTSVYVALRRAVGRSSAIPLRPPVVTSSPVTSHDVSTRDLLLDSTKFDEYHNQTLNQARTSFWFSILFASVGFVVILTSIVISSGAGTLGVISGVITEAVSALFFYQSIELVSKCQISLIACVLTVRSFNPFSCVAR